MPQNPLQALDAALDVALIVIENGGDTGSADRTFDKVFTSLTHQRANTLWRSDFVMATTEAEGQPHTRFRHIDPLGVNLERVTEALALAGRVAGGQADPASVAEDARRIKTMRSHYPLALVVLASAFAAGFFSDLIGGDWGSFVICFIAGGITQLLRARLQLRNLPSSAINVICATAAALISAAGLRAHISDLVAATLIGSVAFMIPGLALVNGFVDVASPRYLSVGVQRIANAVLTFVFLAIGIAIGDAVVRWSS
jgi:uncharacterized membrane protein YjjP (DUF1212 family)